ncbi:MAG TPA: GDSL-type esterase/lipase family protein [Dissulfurispiraceae bacterium]|nr:GDSL-type esterase/lipase family protein [Dissulfurispiraceae bacterium]
MDEALNIIFIGDSLTEYYDWQARFSVHQVLNLGLSGETVQGLSARVRRIISRASAPDLLFVMTGINNLTMEDFDILEDYKRLLRNMKTAFPSTTIIIQSILPVNMWADNKKIEEINKELTAIAKSMKLAFLDVYSLFIEADGSARREYLLEDGVHVSPMGYEVWAAKVADLIDHLSSKSSRSRSSSSKE